MHSLEWVFRKGPADGGRTMGNAGFEAFSHTIDTFCREVIQNSLDAADTGRGLLDLRFRLVRMKGRDLDRFRDLIRWQQVHEHIEAAVEGAGKQRIAVRLRQGLEMIDNNGFLDWLVVEERGAKGLVGPETGEGAFAALCRNNFDSQQKSEGTGGSFGLGKAALWTASRVSTVLFASQVAEAAVPSRHANPRVFGRTELMWHSLGSKEYDGPGWFGTVQKSDGQVHSSWGDTSWLKEIGLDRMPGCTGTSIGIVGFHDADSETTAEVDSLLDKIGLSAANWYFPVMVDGRLKVTLESYDTLKSMANRKPIRTEVVDPAMRLQPWVTALSDFRTSNIAQELRMPHDTVCRDVELKVPPEKNSKPKTPETVHKARLIVRRLAANETVPYRDTIGLSRGRGMIVQYKDARSNLLTSTPFVAILLAGTAAGKNEEDRIAENFLRLAEPPAHNRWDGEGIDLSAHYKPGGKKFLGEFQRAILQTLKSVLESPQAMAQDAPKILRSLFPFGTEPPGKIDRPAPRVQSLNGRIDPQDRWEIEARIKLRTAKVTRRFVATLQFDADSGKNHEVRWLRLEATTPKSVHVEGRRVIVVPPRVGSITLKGQTDPLTHPISARLSRVSLALKAEESEETSAEEIDFESQVQNTLRFD